jgi:SAM-dependent methyltransferase
MGVDFDTYSDRYREEVERSIGFIGQEVDFFAEVKALHLLDLLRRRLGDPRSLRVLDVGCGVGVTDRHLVGRLGELHGVDITPGVIEEARRQVPDVRYEVYDGTRLPHEDGEVDVAFAICVMHHVPPAAWPAFSKELGRVVRPGGLAVVFEHNPFNPLTRRAVDRCEFDEDAVLLRRRTTRKLLAEAGLRPAEAPFITFFPFAAQRMRPIERALRWLPLGAQYYVAATKPA